MSSGQAAETLSVLNLAEAGDHIVSAAWLYGGTYNLFHYTLPKMGMEVTFVGETLPNPNNSILDIEDIAGVAHSEGVPLIVDNTVPTPYLC